VLWNKHAQLRQQNDTTECLTNILSPAGSIIILATISRPALWHMQPLIHWVSGSLSTGVKLPESETDHSPPAGAQHLHYVELPPSQTHIPSWHCAYTGCISKSGDFKNVMNSKLLHLFRFNTYEYSVNIKAFFLN
jgi:hypothetical protein